MIEYLPKIELERLYTLQEVIDYHMIKGVDSYQTLYNMVTFLPDVVRDKENPPRRIVEETNLSYIKPEIKQRPGAKKITKLFIKGQEIRDFLVSHHLDFKIKYDITQ